MLIKNAIVLVDEINLQESQRASRCSPAILDSGHGPPTPGLDGGRPPRRSGMIPLLFDAFFVAMAVTIIGGLLVATVLTMVVLPVFYAIVFRVPRES